MKKEVKVQNAAQKEEAWKIATFLLGTWTRLYVSLVCDFKNTVKASFNLIS